MFVAATAGRARMRGVAGHASELDRRGFIADPTVLSELCVGVDDLGDRDVRAVVIRSEHPEFEEALTSGWREIDLGQGAIDPRMHLTMHEVVATQLWDDSPPEAWDTARRCSRPDTGGTRFCTCSAGRCRSRSGRPCMSSVLMT